MKTQLNSKYSFFSKKKSNNLTVLVLKIKTMYIFIWLILSLYFGFSIAYIGHDVPIANINRKLISKYYSKKSNVVTLLSSKVASLTKAPNTSTIKVYLYTFVHMEINF